VRRWLFVSVGVGCIQLFRTPLEQAIGVVYLLVSAVLFVGWLIRSDLVVTVGFAAVSIAFLARAFTAWAIPGAPWHSGVLVTIAWLAFGREAAIWAVRMATRPQQW